MLKMNDKILFSTGNEKIKRNIGIIIDTKDDNYVVLNRTYNINSLYTIEEKYIDNLINIENVREDIINFYNIQIEELKNKLKTVTSEEKMQERINKYNDTKYRILKNCERITSCSDDEFENRLKEINKLKNELFNIDLECGDVIRKENGKIKYEIKKFENNMNSSLNNISDENIIKAFDYK